MLPPVFAASLYLALLSPTAHAAAGDNINEFTVMCKLFTACEQGISANAAATPNSLDDELETMIAINLTAADKSFFERNFDSDKTHDTDENYTKYKATWAALKKDLGSKKIGTFDLKLTRLPDSALRGYVQRAALAAIAALTSAKDQLSKGPTSQTINNKLKEVLYGDKQAAASADADKTFGSTLAAACGNNGAAENKVGISLSNDLVCLCGGGNTAIAACAGTGATLAGGQAFAAGSQTGTPALTDVRAKCHDKNKGPTSGTELQALLTTFESMIGARDGTTSGAEANYGKGAAATCNAGDGNSCVNYKYQLGAADRGIPWVKKLKSAIADIKALNTKIAEVKQVQTKVKNMEETLLLTYMAAQAIITDSTKTQQKEAADTAAKPRTQTGICKPQNKTPADCPSQHCDYDKEKGCTAKPESKTTAAAGTGETSNAEGKKCSDFNTQPDCEAAVGPVPTGKAKFCGWITYVDGKGKLDTPECRDFSFIVDQKLVLMAVCFKRLMTF
uniref:Variant surface glycoprotein 1125.224 n=1 Tax=Trypanosoma brucei TaxID=5691 RepID=A0A1J0R5H7_9TRYP|nr:variant surface glycoprotein 1125.224 [Trypanosoma brucei]